jgi:hypothetical protein
VTDASGSYFKVDLLNGTSLIFKNLHDLFVCNIKKDILDSSSQAFMSDIEVNKMKFSKKEIEGAKKAKLFIQKLGYPSVQNAVLFLQSGAINQVPCNSSDAYRMLTSVTLKFFTESKLI